MWSRAWPHLPDVPQSMSLRCTLFTNIRFRDHSYLKSVLPSLLSTYSIDYRWNSLTQPKQRDGKRLYKVRAVVCHCDNLLIFFFRCYEFWFHFIWDSLNPCYGHEQVSRFVHLHFICCQTRCTVFVLLQKCLLFAIRLVTSTQGCSVRLAYSVRLADRFRFWRNGLAIFHWSRIAWLSM